MSTAASMRPLTWWYAGNPPLDAVGLMSRSIGLDTGGLDLPRPIIEVVVDELHELLRRFLNELERVGLEQRPCFRRGEGSLDIGSDLIEHRSGHIGRAEQS